MPTHAPYSRLYIGLPLNLETFLESTELVIALCYLIIVKINLAVPTFTH